MKITLLNGPNLGKSEDCYKKLISHFKRTATLNSCSSVLSWDRETYMPVMAGTHRAEQLALLSGIAHEWDTDPRIGEWISECEDSELVEDPLSPQAVNIREIHRIYDKKIKVPKQLVEETSRTTSLGHQYWIEARKKSDFKIFLPWLTKIVDLRREYAYTVGYKDVVYDALLDEYEPGETTENITDIFKSLSRGLVPLIEEIMQSPQQYDDPLPNNNFLLEDQWKLCQLAASSMGFDFSAGRLDTVIHPFCAGLGPADTRITTRWDENNFFSAFFSILHETGHGLYNQGLPSNDWGTPIGKSASLGIHESQSRLWENMVGRNLPFWKFFFPNLKSVFSTQFEGLSLDQFMHFINQVHPSFIRVEADEATYNLHIVLRFEIEQSLISGHLRPADVPAVWNDNFKQLFGLDVPDDAHGCLQDVHWSHGSFGYFPSYALGNLYGAQFYNQAILDLPGMEKDFEKGNFSQLLNWLNEKIYSQGMRYCARDLVKKVTGEPLSHGYLLSNLRNKYSLH